MYSLNSNVQITQNGTVFLIPCLLLPYINEIKMLVSEMPVVDAFLQVAKTHDITLFEKKPLKTVRQQPPARPITLRLNQPVDFFKLAGDAYEVLDINTNIPNYTTYDHDAKYITTFNMKQDTMTYEDMVAKSKPLSTLFKTDFVYLPAICVSIDDSNIRDCVGLIVKSRRTNYLVFVPYIHVKLNYLYTPDTMDRAVFFKRIGCSLDQNSSEINYKYTGSTDLSISTV